MKEEKIMTRQEKTARLAKMSMLAAISVVLVTLVHLPILPTAQFLEYDPADVPIFIGTFAFGPLAGFMLTVVVSFVQGITVSAGGGFWGILMHIIATGTFVLVAGNIYRWKKTRAMALLALTMGTVSMIVIMIPANILIIPIYSGWPRDAVIALLPTAILPFNILKAGINSVITFILYKAISKYLH